MSDTVSSTVSYAPFAAKRMTLPRMARPLFRALILIACAAAVGCTATKTLERRPVSETPGLENLAMEMGAEDAAAYPEQVAGTVRQLYGESSATEQSRTHRDAVAENPLLSYIIVYFDFNRVELKPESREVLMQHADYLSVHGKVKVSIEGHADKRGSSGYNLALGEKRALAVEDFLRANGVRGLQLSAVSYGEERPAVEGSNEEAYAMNRRVELFYR